MIGAQLSYKVTKFQSSIALLKLLCFWHSFVWFSPAAGQSFQPPNNELSPSFYHEVVPALAKLGCSSGACHGSPNGKNGFRLSLRGFDPEADRHAILRDELGRRVNVLMPELSLLLHKPLMKVPHGGGKQLRTSDLGYEILRKWIADGCPVTKPKAECIGIRFATEDSLSLSPDKNSHQLKVSAVMADGSERDVTSLAVFASSDLSVAVVDGNGLVEGKGRGQAGISARFLEHWQTMYVTYSPQQIASFDRWPQGRNQVDVLVDAQLKKLSFQPSDVCTDEQFLRRVYLDIIGLLPTVAETVSFLDDRSENKRATLIDSLLNRPEHAKFWALKWGDLLRINSQQVGNVGLHKYNRWLVQVFAENMPYDQFVTKLLLAQGSTLENPPANFYRTASDVTNTTEAAAQIFMGVRLECCKCHNHPMEKWTQDNYYGFASFFNRLQRKSTRRAGEMVIWISDTGEVTHPRTNRTMSPWLPGQGELQIDLRDRRQSLVEWLTSNENEFLAAVEVNRIWSHLLGRGIVEPVDDFRDSNPPSNPQLLEFLASDFRQRGFDRRHTLRLILNSRTYQSTSLAHDGNKDDEKYFSKYRSRLLTAEQLLDAIGSFAGHPEQFRGLPTDIRATQLPSPDVDSEFLEVFGQPKRETVCQCERVSEVTLSQALQIANGKLVHDKLTAPTGRLEKLLKENVNDRQLIEELYVAAYSRRPSESETSIIIEHLKKKEDRRSALQDIAWALVNSNEFLTQH